MDGGGEFKNRENGYEFSLKGLFKNNLYNHENKMFLNPFNSEQLNAAFVSNFAAHRVKIEKLQKEDFERVRLYRVDISQLQDTLDICKKENRTPLVVGSLE